MKTRNQVDEIVTAQAENDSAWDVSIQVRRPGKLVTMNEEGDQDMYRQESQQTLEDWAGSQHLSLALVFTDIVKSTEIGIKRGDDKRINDLFTHFSMGATSLHLLTPMSSKSSVTL